MKQLGDVLKSCREELGLSLEDMEQRTKIRKRYLEALEDGDWTILPGYVYARGFVRSYADQLGLDGRALLTEYVDQEGDMAKENREADRTRRTSDDPKKTSAQPKPKSEVSTGKPLTLNSVSSRPSPRVQRRAKATHGHRNRGWVGQTFAVVGILAVLGAGLWWITQKSHPTKPYTATNVAANGAGANEGSGSNRTPNSTPLKGDGHTPGTSVSSRTSQRKPTVTAPATSVVVTPQPIQGSHLNYLVKTSLPLHVVLTASSRLWTTVTADGKSLDNGGGEILSSGQSQAFEAKGNLTFVIGNLPAATFVVNGTPITLPNVGHVLNVGFLKTKP